MKYKLMTQLVAGCIAAVMLAGCANVNVNVNINSEEEATATDQADSQDEESEISEIYDIEPEEVVEHDNAEVAGNYINVRTEEMEGEELTITDLVIIQEDQRMFVMTQDLLTYGWYINGDDLVVEDAYTDYIYDWDNHTITLVDGDIETVFTKASDDDENYIAARQMFDDYCTEGIMISSEHWITKYNPYSLYAWTDEDNNGVTFSYCEDGVEISGSQTVTISFVEGKDSKEVLEELKNDNEEPDAKLIATCFGANGQKGYTYIVGSTRDEETEGVQISQDYTALDVEGGAVLVDSFSTLGNDEDTAMRIGNAFEQLLGNFEVR